MAESQIEVEIDGKKVPTNEFVRKVFTGVVEGLVASLKGVNDPREILIKVRKG